MKNAEDKPKTTRPVHIELPLETYDALSLAARDNDRSLRKEVVFRLRASLAPSLAQKIE